MGQGHPPLQSTHIEDVDGLNGVDDRTSAEEEGRLEEGVADEVEDAGGHPEDEASFT